MSRVKHTLTITIEQRDDGKLMVSTDGNAAGGDWLRRDVHYPHALELGLHSIRRATGSGDHEGPKVGPS